MAERILYLPAIGFAACLAMSAFRIAARRRSLAIGALVLLSVAMGIRTYARNSDWRDEESLWTSAVAAAPASFKTHMSMATIYRDKLPESVNLDRAIAEMEQSIGILNGLSDDEKLLRPYILAGQYYRAKREQTGDVQWCEKSRAVLQQGVAVYRAFSQKVLEIQTMNPGAPFSVKYGAVLYRDLGLACMCLQQNREALTAFDIALSLPDRDAATYAEITQARRTLGVQ
jgi:hypothetical protein